MPPKQKNWENNRAVFNFKQKTLNSAQNLQISLKPREITGSSVDFSLSDDQQSSCAVLGQDSKS